MKKITALLLALLCSFSLVACGEKDPPAVNPDNDPPVTPVIDPVSTAEYTHSYVDMVMELPEGWAWETYTDNGSDKTEGIRFYKTDDPAVDWMLLCWTGGYGICGTGVESQSITLTNGQVLTQHTEASGDGQVWVNIIFEDVPGCYVVSPTNNIVGADVWEDCREELLAILTTVEIGRKAITQEAAIAAAKAIYDGSYDMVYGTYDVTSGAWIVTFSQSTVGGTPTRVTVDAAGKAILGVK